jgi:hypothetical protein
MVWFNAFLSVCNIMTCTVTFECHSILTSICVISQNDRKFELYAFQKQCLQQCWRGDIRNTISQSIIICFTSFKKRYIASLERHFSAISSKCFRRIFTGPKHGIDPLWYGCQWRWKENGHISTNTGMFCPPEGALESLGVEYCILLRRNNKFLCYYIH